MGDILVHRLRRWEWLKSLRQRTPYYDKQPRQRGSLKCSHWLDCLRGESDADPDGVMVLTLMELCVKSIQVRHAEIIFVIPAFAFRSV